MNIKADDFVFNCACSRFGRELIELQVEVSAVSLVNDLADNLHADGKCAAIGVKLLSRSLAYAYTSWLVTMADAKLPVDETKARAQLCMLIEQDIDLAMNTDEFKAMMARIKR